MQVRIEEVSPVEKKMIVAVPWPAVDIKLKNAYRELAKGVQLRGFRRGKVPRTVLQQMFGKRIHAEVASQLVQESFISAATEHKLEAVSEPIVEQELKIKRGQPFEFEAVIQVKGDVVAKDYDGMALNKRPLVIEDEEVDKALQAIREENTELQPIEGRDVSARTDILSVSIKGTLGEDEVDRPNMPVDLSESENEPLPGLIDALLGLPLNTADHQVSLTIPEDYRESSIAGKTAEFTISILDAREKEVPELDDDLAKDTGRAETLDELRAVVRTEIEERKADEIKQELRQTALDELVKLNQIPVASALVERALDMQMQRFRMMLGMPADQSGEELGLTGELREKMQPKALDEVRGQLLLDAIATTESIEVTDDDVEEHLVSAASARNMPLARLRAEYDRDGRLDGIKFQLRQDKTLDLLIERAEITEKEPEPEAVESAADEASADDSVSAEAEPAADSADSASAADGGDSERASEE